MFKKVSFTGIWCVIAALLGFILAPCSSAGVSTIKDRDCFVLSWLVCGPFPNYPADDSTDYGHHTKLCWGYQEDFFKDYGGETGIIPHDGMVCKYGNKDFAWKRHTAQGYVIDFNRIFPPGKDSVAYAYCELDAPKDIEGEITVGSDDGVKVWVNHKLVHDHHLARGIAQDEDVIPVKIKKGRNPVLVKIDNDWGGFGFCLRAAVTQKETAGRLRDKLFFEQNKFIISSAKEAVSVKIALRDAPLSKYNAVVRQIAITGPDGKIRKLKGERKIKDEILFSAGENLPGLYRFTITVRDNSGGEKDLPGSFWYLPQTASPEKFSFVQITDIHVSTPDTVQAFMEAIREMNSLDEKPCFVVATGDLVNNGNNEPEYENYRKAAAEFRLPLCNVIGNHDAPVEKFNRFLGLDYYSFDMGRRHFVCLNCLNPPRYSEWLKKDLESQPKEKEIIVFQHYHPDKSLLDFLSQYNTRALFYGHWHSNKTFYYGKIKVVSTPSLRFGGIDCSPAGFRVVTCGRNGQISTECRWSGILKQVSVVWPAGEVGRDKGTIPVIASVYDTSRDVESVQYSVDGGNWKRMSHAGGWVWQAEEDIKEVPDGSHTVKIKADPDSGPAWEKEGRFTLVKSSRKQPAIIWSRYAGGGTGFAAPVVGDSRIYLSVQDDDNAINGGVVCLDREKGRVRWTFKSGVSINGTPAVSQGTVCAVSVTGSVFGLDASTGRELWRYNLGDSWERWVYNSPVISKGVVYCGVAPYFVALDLKTGKELWRGPSMGSDWISCRTSPESDGKNVYIGFNWSNGLFALDKKTGTVVWNKKEGCSSTHVMKPVVENNLLYYAADGKLYALEKETGKEVWNASLEGGCPASSPAIKGLFLVTGTPGGQISAFNRETGKKTWSFQTGAGLGSFSPYVKKGSQVTAAPAIYGSTVYAGSNDGTLYALDLKTGNLLWNCNLGIPILSRPTVSGGTLYVSTCDGNIFAFTLLR